MEYINELSAFIHDIYGLSILEIKPTKRGFYGETWIARTSGSEYFIKIDYWDFHKDIYKNSFRIVKYFNDNEIPFVPKLIATKEKELYSYFNGGVIGIFESIDGINTEDYPIEMLFEKLIIIYKQSTGGIIIEREKFDYGVISRFKRIAAELPNEILELIEHKSAIIRKFERRLKQFADFCKKDQNGFYLTHGDAGGNCIISDDKFHIVDWDQPMLAPIERDAWVFMWSDEQINTINKLLIENGFPKLDINRFCFYCYYSFFLYLSEYLQKYLHSDDMDIRAEIISEIEKYFDSWIFRVLNVADAVAL